MRAAADGKIPDVRGSQGTLYALAGGRAERAGPVAFTTFKLDIYLNLTECSAHDRQQCRVARQTIIGAILCPQLNLSLAQRRAGAEFAPPPTAPTRANSH